MRKVLLSLCAAGFAAWYTLSSWSESSPSFDKADRAKIYGPSMGGFPEDASVTEAVRRSNFLRHDPAAINLTLKIGKAIAGKAFATEIDVPPDVWYAFQPAHAPSCADAEMVAGVWTCGLRRLRCGCVAYVISHTTHQFSDAVEALTPCKVYRFGPAAGSVWDGTLSAVDGEDVPERTIVSSRDASIRYAFRPVELKPTGRVLSGRSLTGLMAAYGHSRLDVLHLDLAGGEYAVLEALRREGFPPIATLSMQLHFLSRPLLDAAFGTLWAAGFRDYRTELLPSASQKVSFLGREGVAPRSEPHADEVIAARLAARVSARAQPDGVSVGFPAWSCDEGLVGFFGDGTKWVCGLRQLAARRGGCVVYSFGGAANTQFENAIRDITSCEVHTFDLDCTERCLWGGPCYAGPRLTCHKVRVGGSDNAKTMPPTMSLPTMMRTLGHRRIDILKIDIEGAERDLFRGLAKQRFDWSAVGQVLLETHEPSIAKDEGVLLELIEQAGGKLAAFHSEVNIYHTQVHPLQYSAHCVAPARLVACVRLPRCPCSLVTAPLPVNSHAQSHSCATAPKAARHLPLTRRLR